ncbi:MAG: hypothetical protein ABIA97_03915 [Candidatus Omnitrophota bacterium]
MPIPQNKIQQFVVQFACRIPARRELTAGEKNTLENLLRELDHDHFQLPQKDPSQDSALLFQVVHQNTIARSSAMITSPTFTFFRDNFSFYYPVMMMNSYILTYSSLITRERNNPISEWANRVLVAVNSRCQRAGKIYLMVLGPFTPDEKITIFQNLCSQNVNLNETGELNFTFAYCREHSTTVYNISNSISFQTINLTDQFFINVKIDINNRELRTAMEPPDMERVWNYADSIIFGHLDTLLSIT